MAVRHRRNRLLGGDVHASIGCSRACACPVCFQRASRCRRSRAGRSREERRKGRLVHHADRESGHPSAQGGVREEVSRHRAAVFARRRDADRRQDPRGGRGQPRAGRRLRRYHQHDPAQAGEAAGVLCPIVRRAVSAGAQGPWRPFECTAALRLHSGHQHHAGPQGARTQDLPGPARSPVEGENRLGSKLDRGCDRLRRQHPHQHGRAARDGISGRSRPNESSMSKPRRAPSSIRSSPANMPSG